MLIAQAAEDVEGFIEHNGDVLDIFLLVAVIVFIGAAAVAWAVQPASSVGHGPLDRAGLDGLRPAVPVTPTAYIVLGAVLAAVIILLIIVL